MKSRHFLICTAGSLGDLFPFITLANGLKARGHQVTLLTNSEYRERVEKTGIRFVPMQDDLRSDDADLIRKVMEPLRGAEVLFRDIIFPRIEIALSQLLPLAEASDVIIVGSLAYAAPTVAEFAKKPWVNVTLSPSVLFSLEKPAILPFAIQFQKLFNGPKWLHRLIRKLFEQNIRAWAKPLNQWRQRHGLNISLKPVTSDFFSPTLNLGLYSRHFTESAKDWPINYRMTGFLFSEQNKTLPPDVVTFINEGPFVVFTLGSAVVHVGKNYFQIAESIASHMGLRALFISGQNKGRRTVGSAQILEIAYAPYSEVFSKAILIVHQCGIGTTAEVLRSGVPSLGIPFGLDQPDNAFKMEQLGVAEFLPNKKFDVHSGVKMIRKIFRLPKYKMNAEKMKREINKESGLQNAIDLLEAL